MAPTSNHLKSGSKPYTSGSSLVCPFSILISSYISLTPLIVTKCAETKLLRRHQEPTWLTRKSVRCMRNKQEFAACHPGELIQLTASVYPALGLWVAEVLVGTQHGEEARKMLQAWKYLDWADYCWPKQWTELCSNKPASSWREREGREQSL